LTLFFFYSAVAASDQVIACVERECGTKSGGKENEHMDFVFNIGQKDISAQSLSDLHAVKFIHLQVELIFFVRLAVKIKLVFFSQQHEDIDYLIIFLPLTSYSLEYVIDFAQIEKKKE
jgi:hypothetical protein